MNDLAQSIKVIAFDVFGTVVDWHGSVAREVEAMRLGVDGGEFALAWRAGWIDDDAMQALADELSAGNKPCIVQASKRPETPAGELDADKVGAVIGALLPEGAVVSDESVTSGAAA